MTWKKGNALFFCLVVASDLYNAFDRTIKAHFARIFVIVTLIQMCHVVPFIVGLCTCMPFSSLIAYLDRKDSFWIFLGQVWCVICNTLNS